MNILAIVINVLLMVAVSAASSSSSIEDRLKQVETQLLSTNTELDRVKRDRVEDGEEVKKLKNQVESQREELMEAKSKMDDQDRRIQEIQSICCCGNGQQLTTTATLSVNQDMTTLSSSLTNEVTDNAITTEEPMNTEIEVVDIGTEFARLAVIKELNVVATGLEGGVRIYDLRSKQLVRTLDNSWVDDILPFRQNQLIQATENTIKIWNVENGELLRSIQCQYCSHVTSLALNKDESLMLSGDGNNRIVLWDMTEYKEIRMFWGDNFRVRVATVLFNEAKDQVISASEETTIIVWNMNDSSIIRTLTGHSGEVFKILLDEETGHLYSSSYDSTIKEWDLESGVNLRTFTTSVAINLIWSEDGKRLISSGDNSVRIWSKETGQVINQLNHTDYLYGLALNPLNGQLMSTSWDNKLIFWPLKP